MPKKIVPDLEDQNEPEENLQNPPKEETPVRDMNDIVSEMDGDVESIVIYKQNEQFPTRFDYVCRMGILDWDFEMLKNNYGGGLYRAKFQDKHGKYKRQNTFSISDLINPSASSKPITGNMPHIPFQSNEMGEIKNLLERQTQLLSVMLENKNREPVPQESPLNIALKMADLITRNTAVPLPPQMGFDKMFEVMKMGIEMGKGMDGDDFWTTAQTMVKPVLETIQEFNRNGQKIVEKVNNGKDEKMKKEKPKTFNDYLKEALPQFINLAKNAKDPSLYGSLMLDQVPQGWYEEIHKMCSEPDFFETLVLLNPDVKNYETWFKSFILSVKDSLTTETVDNENIS